MHNDHQPAASPSWGTAHHWRWQGLHCHWQRLGDPGAPALVLLHGFGAGSGHWRHNAGALAAAVDPAATAAERSILGATLATRLAEIDTIRAARRSRQSAALPDPAADSDPDPALVLTTSPVGIDAAEGLLASSGDLAAIVGDRLAAVGGADGVWLQAAGSADIGMVAIDVRRVGLDGQAVPVPTGAGVPSSTTSPPRSGCCAGWATRWSRSRARWSSTACSTRRHIAVRSTLLPVS
jgi:hypothetical protein